MWKDQNNNMNYKEIVDLIKMINKTELSEVVIKDGEFNLKVRTKNYNSNNGMSPTSLPAMPVAYSQATAPVASPPETTQDVNPSSIPDLKPVESEKSSGGDEKLVEVKSPIVGTFYRSSSPDKAPYAKVGDEISVGSVVCIVEAMKLFNEIESEVAGKIVKVMVEDASPVEYDQVLFLVDPS